MFKSLTIAAGTAVIATMLATASASAAPLNTLSSPSVTTENLVQSVQWRRCRAWRHECAQRWGWGGHNFRRCLARHGC